MLRCCKTCSPVENSKEVVCSTKDDSVAKDCNVNYTLVDGKCEGEKELLSISIKLDGNYDDFIEDPNNSEKMKQALCNILHRDRNIELDKCNETLQLMGFDQGSLIVNFQIKNEKYSEEKILESDINTMFSKGKTLDNFNMEIMDHPEIKIREVSGDTLVKCIGEYHTHICPFGTKIKYNAENIYGITDRECCQLDWNILKVIIPIFLIGLLFIFIIYKKTLGKIIRKKS